MSDTTIIAERVHEFVLAGFAAGAGEERLAAAPDVEWQKIRAAGTALWLDTGDLDEASKLWCAEFSGLTTNNTLLNQEVQKGLYDNLVGRAAAALREAMPTVDERTLVLEVAFVLNAWHGLRLVQRFGAHVSVEVHTDLADDLERSVAYGKRYHAICPEKFYVKVPLTPTGLLAARKLAAAGVPINLTLGFSARQNYAAALLTQAAYVNVFMGRLNAFVADHGLGDGANAGEKATLATQRELIALRQAGRTHSRLIGASMRAGGQVGALAGLDVLTMPVKVAAQYREQPQDRVASPVETDPEVIWAPGMEGGDCNADTLWAVPNAFKQSVAALLKQDVDTLRGEDLQAHFDNTGFGDFLPCWSEEAIAVIREDGKIPSYTRWHERLASRQIGLDALMNISGLQSFVQDQQALDDRIRSLL